MPSFKTHSLAILETFFSCSAHILWDVSSFKNAITSLTKGSLSWASEIDPESSVKALINCLPGWTLPHEIHMEIFHAEWMFKSWECHVEAQPFMWSPCRVCRRATWIFGDPHEPRILGGVCLGYAGAWTLVEIMLMSWAKEKKRGWGHAHFPHGDFML